MQSFWIVEALNVIVGCTHRMFVCFVFLVVDLFDFETFEKTFHRRIVITVSFATHALQEVALSKSRPEGQAGVLRSTIGVDDQTVTWFPQSDRLVDRGQGAALQSDTATNWMAAFVY